MKQNKTLIIAEAGVNHNGKLNIAKKLINQAKNAGADIIKFQTFFTKNMVTKSAKKALYQKKSSKLNESQYNMLRPLELSKKNHYKLINYCKKMKVEFLSTAFDIESISFLINLISLSFIIKGGISGSVKYL